MKLAAVQLLLDNLDNTFVTPVFNGSASLRDAAGQLIESVTKSVRRGQTVDDAYIDALYEDTEALYHLDAISPAEDAGTMGPLPGASVALLWCLGGAWVCILGYWAFQALRRRKNRTLQ